MLPCFYLFTLFPRQRLSLWFGFKTSSAVLQLVINFSFLLLQCYWLFFCFYFCFYSFLKENRCFEKFLNRVLHYLKVFFFKWIFCAILRSSRSCQKFFWVDGFFHGDVSEDARSPLHLLRLLFFVAYIYTDFNLYYCITEYLFKHYSKSSALKRYN